MAVKRKPKKTKRYEIMDRQILGYPHPKYFQLFMAFAHINCWGKSETSEHIIKDFFDKMPESERNSLKILWEEMTPEQRKHPKRTDETDGN